MRKCGIVALSLVCITVTHEPESRSTETEDTDVYDKVPQYLLVIPGLVSLYLKPRVGLELAPSLHPCLPPSLPPCLVQNWASPANTTSVNLSDWNYSGSKNLN